MTEYIGNAFSVNMITEDCRVRITPIDEEEFVEHGKTGNSVIGHVEVAETFGLEYNREHISLLPGDVLYAVVPGDRPKSMLGTFIPREKGYVYRRIEVLRDD